ncbi:MAG: hypothetical protein OHK0048_15130 [Rhodoferax sp.]
MGTAVGLGLLLGGTSTLAQWVWLDDAGRKVFSDRAPGPEVPAQRVLKRPGQAQSAQNAPETIANHASGPNAQAASEPAQAKASAPISKADQELLKRKAAAEQAEQAKRKAEESRLAAARAENCRRAQAALKNLQSGRRIAHVNAQGDTEVMSDATRAAEVQRIQGIIESDCR